MGNHFNNFIGKYFDNIYQVPALTEERLQNLFFELINNLQEELSSSKSREHFEEELKPDIKDLYYYYRTSIRNFRNFKTFESKLKSNFQKVGRDIYVSDLILMSLIEAIDFELFKSIKSNPEIFISQELTSTDSAFYLRDLYREEKAFLEKLIPELSNWQQNILFQIFPLLEVIHNTDFSLKSYDDSSFREKRSPVLTEIESKQKLSHPLIFPLYFQSVSSDKAIRKLVDKDYKQQILQLASESSSIDKIVDELRKLFPEGDSFKEYRRLSINWISRIIKNKDLDISRKLVLSLSWLAKRFSTQRTGMFITSEKKQASFQIWIYCEREGADKEILLQVQSDKSSDAFATSAVFYTLHEDRTPGNLKFNESFKVKLCEKYLNRVFGRLNNGFSIFDTKKFDDYIQSIWRWKDAESFLLQTEEEDYNFQYVLADYLLKEVAESISKFESFLKLIVTSDYGREPMISIKEDRELISEENLRKVIANFKQNSELNKLSEFNYIAVSNFMEE